jgi:hypothetical protein
LETTSGTTTVAPSPAGTSLPTGAASPTATTAATTAVAPSTTGTTLATGGPSPTATTSETTTGTLVPTGGPSSTGTTSTTGSTAATTAVAPSTTGTPLPSGAPSPTGTTAATTAVAPSTTGTSLPSGAALAIGIAAVASSTTGTVIPTGTASASTTTINYCAQENGMNQPLTIRSDQVISNPPSQPTTPGDINPTTSTSTPGLNFASTSPQINITLDQPSAITVIYLPTDRPNQPTNVNQFTVVFVYPNGTISQEFTSNLPSTGGTTTTTPSIGTSSGTTSTSGPSFLVLPSAGSPEIDLPSNFAVPELTIVVVTVISTKDGLNASGVCMSFFFED